MDAHHQLPVPLYMSVHIAESRKWRSCYLILSFIVFQYWVRRGFLQELQGDRLPDILQYYRQVIVWHQRVGRQDTYKTCSQIVMCGREFSTWSLYRSVLGIYSRNRWHEWYGAGYNCMNGSMHDSALCRYIFYQNIFIQDNSSAIGCFTWHTVIT